MKVELEVSAILSENNQTYDLFLLLWYGYRIKNGKPMTDKPVFREFGSPIKCRLAPGDYLITYGLGGFIGEEHVTIEKNTPFKTQYNLNAGVIRPNIMPSIGAAPDEEEGMLLCSTSFLKPTRVINLSHPIPCISGQDLVLPAGIDYAVQGRILGDEDHYSPELTLNLEAGVIRTMDFIADKTQLELLGF